MQRRIGAFPSNQSAIKSRISIKQESALPKLTDALPSHLQLRNKVQVTSNAWEIANVIINYSYGYRSSNAEASVMCVDGREMGKNMVLLHLSLLFFKAMQRWSSF